MKKNWLIDFYNKKSHYIKFYLKDNLVFRFLNFVFFFIICNINYWKKIYTTIAIKYDLILYRL